MSAFSATESTPLIASELRKQIAPSNFADPPPSPKPQRSVTFDANVTSSSFESDSAPRRSNGAGGVSNATTSAAAGVVAASNTGTSTNISTSTSNDAIPVISTLNNKLLRRRQSQGSTTATTPAGTATATVVAAAGTAAGLPKMGPHRTTKTAEKLKILPNPEHGDDGPDEESGRDVYAQYTRIKDPRARSDAARLGRQDRERLPRVTAYCTAASYRMPELMRYLKSKKRARAALPKLFDECIYTPYNYVPPPSGSSSGGVGGGGGGGGYNSGHREEQLTPPPPRRYSDSTMEVESDQYRGSLSPSNESSFYDDERISTFGTATSAESRNEPLDIDITVHTPEVFLFNYGTVVIWGMSVIQEQRFLKEIAKFEVEKLAKDDVQTEDFNFYYTKEYQARIYNDFISLMDKKNYMTKLAISHALSQSVKTSLYEDLVDNTIETTKDIPAQIALTGKVNLSRREINMQIGELFILRINIHLQGSVLDAPELMWAEPQLDPIYQAVRSYLEMDQRVDLLTERLSVIADLLAVLKDQLTHTHGEYLEWIVIVLIAAEIVVAAVNIIVDVYAGVD